MKQEPKAYLELHLAIFLWGFTAILGDLIQLSALTLVWWRVLLTSISLLPLIAVGRLLREVPRHMLWRYAGIGVLIGLHWLAFYGAVKLANASVSLICMATVSFFISMLEPLILKRSFLWYELGLGLLIIPGMMLVVQSTDTSMNLGILVGLISAFLAAVFTALNKKYIHDIDPIKITFIEMSAAWLFMCPVLLIASWQSDTVGHFWPRGMDWAYLIFLAVACTSLAQWLGLRALRHISAFASALSVNLEPVYGIAMAWVLLNDHQEVGPHFYLGVIVILMAVFCYPFLHRYNRKRNRSKLKTPS